MFMKSIETHRMFSVFFNSRSIDWQGVHRTPCQDSFIVEQQLNFLRWSGLHTVDSLHATGFVRHRLLVF